MPRTERATASMLPDPLCGRAIIRTRGEKRQFDLLRAPAPRHGASVLDHPPL